MDIRNKEGYMDKTPFEAIKAMERNKQPQFDYHPMVYICSPYAGNIDENVQKVQRYSRFAVERGYLRIEIYRARCKGYKVRYFDNNCREIDLKTNLTNSLLHLVGNSCRG